MKDKLCSNCINGKKSVELDMNSIFCPYIAMYKDNKCPMYIELEEKPKYEPEDENVKFWLV